MPLEPWSIVLFRLFRFLPTRTGLALRGEDSCGHQHDLNAELAGIAWAPKE